VRFSVIGKILFQNTSPQERKLPKKEYPILTIRTIIEKISSRNFTGVSHNYKIRWFAASFAHASTFASWQAAAQIAIVANCHKIGFSRISGKVTSNLASLIKRLASAWIEFVFMLGLYITKSLRQALFEIYF
jgi:hypothetical protein